MLPVIVFTFAMSSIGRQHIYYDLWYYTVIAATTPTIGAIFVRDTLDTDLNAND